MKVAFIIGHHRLGKGAYSAYFNKKEYDFWKNFECELMELGEVFHHNPFIPGYNSRQKEIAKRTAHFDLVIEVHFLSLIHISEPTRPY